MILMLLTPLQPQRPPVRQTSIATPPRSALLDTPKVALLVAPFVAPRVAQLVARVVAPLGAPLVAALVAASVVRIQVSPLWKVSFAHEGV